MADADALLCRDMKWTKAAWGTLVNVVLGFVNLALLFLLLFPTSIQLDLWRGLSVHDTQYRDALAAAVQLGRLDGISALLTVLGVILGLFAIVSFAYFKYGAEEAAREVANDVARETAREVAERATKSVAARPEGQEVQGGKDPGSIDVRDKESEDEKGGGNDDDGGRTNAGH